MTPWIRIAKIMRTKGSKGSVVCKSANGLPFLMRDGLEISIVPPLLRGVRDTTVQTVSEMSDGLHEVHLQDVDDLSSAKPLAGHWCLALRKDIPGLPKRYTPETWRGYSVEDLIYGDLGTIRDVQIAPVQSRIEVSGDKGLTIIPIVDAFIVQIDNSAHHILTHIPEGLIGIGNEEGSSSQKEM